MPRIFLRSIPAAMCNAGCGNTIIAALAEKGIPVQSIEINIPARRCKAIIPDSVVLQDSEIEEALEDVGFSSFASKSDTSNVVKLFYKGLCSTCLGLILLVLAAWGIVIPIIWGLISIGVAIGLGWETWTQAWHAWRTTKKLTIDTLFALSTIIMLAVSIAGLFPLLGIKLLCDMVLLTFGIKYLGIVLQECIKDNQTGEQSLLDRIPPEYTVELDTGKEVALKNLQPGDFICLSGGQYIPVDVECLSECAVTNAIADGQVASPKIFLAGTRLNQGMNLDLTSGGKFKVVSTYKDSYCYKMYTHIRELQNQQQTTSLSKVLQYLVIAVILIAIITGFVFYGWHCPWQLTLNAIMCVLNSACPCTLGLNRGLTAQVVRAKMQKENMQSYNAKLLQTPLKHIVFDWNGTLIESEPSEITVQAVGETKHDLNKLVYRLEKNQPHPYARAICHKLTSQYSGLMIESKDENLHIQRPNHSCIAAVMGEKYYRIGNADGIQGKIAEYKRVIIENEGEKAFACHQYIYIEEGEGDAAQLIGYIKLGVKLRRGAKKIIKYFQDRNIQVHICTGADEPTVQAHLENAGIQNVIVHANCAALPESQVLNPALPEVKHSQRDKLTCVQELQQQGDSVAGVGDAANDIPFLLQCDIGVAMQSPAADAMTQEVANFSIQSLFDLPFLLPRVEAILRAAARLKDTNDIINCILNLLVMFIPLLMMGLWGFMCPPCLGPLLMLVPLLGVCANTAYSMTEQPVTKSGSCFPVSGTTADLFTPEKLGYPVPKPLPKKDVTLSDCGINYGSVAPMVELTALPARESGPTFSHGFSPRRLT